MEALKKLFKENSPYLVGLTIVETVLSIVCTLAFVYSDTLSYENSIVFKTIGIEKLLESIYSSTWWALILLILAFIAILSITSIVFHKMEYLFMGIMLWGEMLILAINLNNSLIDIFSILALFIPIILINIIAYKTQENKLKKTKTKKKTNK